MEEIMRICYEALEEAGYTDINYSETYQRIIVHTTNNDVKIEFDEK